MYDTFKDAGSTVPKMGVSCNNKARSHSAHVTSCPSPDQNYNQMTAPDCLPLTKSVDQAAWRRRLRCGCSCSADVLAQDPLPMSFQQWDPRTRCIWRSLNYRQQSPAIAIVVSLARRKYLSTRPTAGKKGFAYSKLVFLLPEGCLSIPPV